ncbi:FAD-binding Berberine family protein [Striga asiatica]|uniref:FAD-binding Berberine family protein n=1 Tax=Striga asiatica TaxID=4170 RepID=A0A5A7R7D3_STRAF|nr:FAD-binding Berberine family protein [Striga asiatica]
MWESISSGKALSLSIEAMRGCKGNWRVRDLLEEQLLAAQGFMFEFRQVLLKLCRYYDLTKTEIGIPISSTDLTFVVHNARVGPVDARALKQRSALGDTGFCHHKASSASLYSRSCDNKLKLSSDPDFYTLFRLDHGYCCECAVGPSPSTPSLSAKRIATLRLNHAGYLFFLALTHRQCPRLQIQFRLAALVIYFNSAVLYLVKRRHIV